MPRAGRRRLPPEGVTGLREPVPAAQVLHRQARFGLPQEPDDLRLAESFSSRAISLLVSSDSKPGCYSIRGGDVDQG